MEENVRLTVVVPTFNRAHLLPELLDALNSQVVPPDLTWELIVVDNNSFDDTRSVIEAAQASFRVPITYLFERSQGLSIARNTGIKHSKGEIIAFIDDDAIPAGNWVAMVVRAMHDCQADVIGGRILLRWIVPAPRWLLDEPGLHTYLALMDHAITVRLTTATGRPAIWGANMAFTSDCLAQIGGFDPGLGPVGAKLYRGGEEVDLIRRALDKGKTVVYDPRLVVWHRIDRDRMRRSYFRRFYFEMAEGEAIRQASRSHRNLFGAPLHSYRRAVTSLARWLSAVSCLSRDVFQMELAFLAALGRLLGHWKKYFGEERAASAANSSKKEGRSPRSISVNERGREL